MQSAQTTGWGRSCDQKKGLGWGLVVSVIGVCGRAVVKMLPGLLPMVVERTRRRRMRRENGERD